MFFWFTCIFFKKKQLNCLWNKLITQSSQATAPMTSWPFDLVTNEANNNCQMVCDVQTMHNINQTNCMELFNNYYCRHFLAKVYLSGQRAIFSFVSHFRSCWCRKIVALRCIGLRATRRRWWRRQLTSLVAVQSKKYIFSWREFLTTASKKRDLSTPR